jgi:predicted nucleic-acid-binding protein
LNAILDTNILVRLLTNDDPKQVESVQKCLLQADRFIIPTTVLCELVWVLAGVYKLRRR